MIVFLVLVFLLVQIWPIANPSAVADGSVWKPVTLPYIELSDEKRMIFIVLLSGGIGGMIHALQSFVGFVGSKSFISSWLWWYVIRPCSRSGACIVILFITSRWVAHDKYWS